MFSKTKLVALLFWSLLRVILRAICESPLYNGFLASPITLYFIMLFYLLCKTYILHYLIYLFAHFFVIWLLSLKQELYGSRELVDLVYISSLLPRTTESHKSILSKCWMLLRLLSSFSRVRLCATPQTAAHQAPPSLGFSRQERWSALPFPSPMHESQKWKWSLSVVSDSSRPHGLQPTRLIHPWDFPGKNTGVRGGAKMAEE